VTVYPGVLLGAHYEPPPPPRDLWTGARMFMNTSDGKRWAFAGGYGSGVRMKSGVRGLSNPDYVIHKTPYASLAGSRYRGSRAVDREVFWPIWVWNDQGDQEWMDYDASFWAHMDPDEVVVWEVEQPNGTSRYLDVRFVSDNGATFEKAPGMRKWVPYGINLSAEQPYWRGEKQTPSWGAGLTPVPFFGGIGSPGGPPFYISSDALVENATVYNEGDVDTWPRITFEGPFTNVEVTINGFTIAYAPDIAAGSKLVVDTDPTVQGAFLNGTRVTNQLSPRQFAPLPARSQVPVTLNVTGTGTVSMEFTPLFRRAW